MQEPAADRRQTNSTTGYADLEGAVGHRIRSKPQTDTPQESMKAILLTLGDILADVGNTLEAVQAGQDAILAEVKALGTQVGEAVTPQVTIEVPETVEEDYDDTSPGIGYAEARELLDAEPPYRVMGDANKMTEYERVMYHPMFTRPKLWANMKAAREQLHALRAAMPHLTQREMIGLITETTTWRRLCPNERMVTQNISSIDNLYIIFHKVSSGGFSAVSHLSSRRLHAFAESIKNMLARRG